MLEPSEESLIGWQHEVGSEKWDVLWTVDGVVRSNRILLRCDLDVTSVCLDDAGDDLLAMIGFD